MEKTFADFYAACLHDGIHRMKSAVRFFIGLGNPLDVFNNFVRLERIDIYAGSIAYQADDGRLLAFAVVGFEPKRFHGFEQGGDLLFFCVRFENDNHLCPDPFDLAILCVKVYAVSGRLSRRLNEKYLCRQQGKGEKLAEQSHLSVVINIGATTFASINWAISVIDGYGAVRILLCIL